MKPETILRQAINFAGLGLIEYNRKLDSVLLNDNLLKWFGIDKSQNITLSQFAAYFINREEIEQTVCNAFNFNLKKFSLLLLPKNDKSNTYHGKCELKIEAGSFTSIINPSEIKDSKEIAFQFADEVPAIIWSTNSAGYCNYLNNQWEKFTGAKVQNSLGLAWLNCVHNDDREHVESKFLESIRDQLPYKVLLRIKNITGQYRWCIDHGTPRFSPDGSFQGLIGTVIDVHEESIANENSIYRQEELISMIESAPFPIGVYIGQELKIKVANKSMLQTWGKGENVFGKLYTDILPELGNQEIFQELRSVIETGKAVHRKNKMIYLIEKNEIITYYFNYSFTPLLDVSGNVYGVMNTAVDVTDFILATNKSQRNEKRFIKLLESSPAGIGVFVGSDFKIETLNSTFASLLGHDKNVIGKPFADVIDELNTDGAPFLEILEKVYKTGIPHETFGTKVKHLTDGMRTDNYYNFTYTPMFDENGEVYAILDIVVDVTENVLAQNKVLESEKSLRNTILRAPVAMCILLQQNFLVEIANNRMLELWQVDDSILGKPFFDYLPEAREQGFEKLLFEVINEGKSISAFERHFTRKINGEVHKVYVDFVYEPFRDSDNHITGVIVVAHDVTFQVLARQTIENAEERARLAIEAADLGVYELNLQTQELITSPRFDEIWNVENTESRLQIVNKIHPQDIETRRIAHEIALETGNLDYEARIIREEGSNSWFRAKGRVLADHAGKPKTLIGVVQDITEQKRFSDELTRLVSQRTTELQRSNEDLQQFAHVASHDLKEPVRKIKFYSNMLQDDCSQILPERALMHLEKIHNATDRMFSMIEGVLKYASVQGASKDIETIDLNAVFENVKVDLEVIINKKNVQIHLDKLPIIEGIAVLIHQLFYNILNNALKFSSLDKQPVITVSSEIVQTADVALAKIVIADNGIGLDPNYVSKIFNPFIRLNPKDKYEGTGLGLSLCKKIAEKHHGTISANGSYANGAQFTITLPLTQSGDLYVVASI